MSLSSFAQHDALPVCCFQHAVERGLCFLDGHGAHGAEYTVNPCLRHWPLVGAFDGVFGELHEAVAEVEAVGLAAVQDLEADRQAERIGFGQQDLQDRGAEARVVMAAVEIEGVELDLPGTDRGSRRNRPAPRRPGSGAGRARGNARGRCAARARGRSGRRARDARASRRCAAPAGARSRPRSPRRSARRSSRAQVAIRCGRTGAPDGRHAASRRHRASRPTGRARTAAGRRGRPGSPPARSRRRPRPARCGCPSELSRLSPIMK